ncbi:MAG: Rpn family recombination-promoting nuclease/putative transposase [Spirochaetaceae bacterium]|nr:Rpn family recombination-promoting nuclease/putative transposase [Spirochaetaceae bacterium]
MTVSQNATRRNYKDSVFVDLFAHDISAKENFISLYNALHGTNLDAETTEIQPVMLEKVLYMKYYNDVAMLVDNKIVVMIEHQSTVNENMPFRFLEYIARIYEKITNPKEKFERKLMKLPVPEFYVFYNGKEDFPSESEMKLSDAFIKLDENKNFPLEISVKVININVGKENPVLNRCEALKEYSEFMEQVKFNIENEIPEAFTVAIKQSIKQGFLSDYLSRKSTEVENMLLTEYDYDTDIAVQRQEAYEDGAQQKAIETAKNALKMDLPIKQISTLTGLSIEEIQALVK